MGCADQRTQALRIELVHSPEAGRVVRIAMTLEQGASLVDALQRGTALGADYGGISLEALSVGIWGRVMPLDTLLRDRDRVEIYRSLTVDPKEARRMRYRKSADKSKRVRNTPRV